MRSQSYPVGYQALVNHFNLQVIPHFRASYVSLTGAKRTYTQLNQDVYIYPKEYALSDPTDPFLNLEFALKHEGMNRSIIKLVFEKLTTQEILGYINSKIQGKAQRKLWYLFEFLMQKKTFFIGP